MIKRLIFDIDGTLIAGVNFLSAVSNTLRKFDLYSKENVEKFFSAMYSYESVYNAYTKENYLQHFKTYLECSLPDEFVATYFEELKSVISSSNSKLLDVLTKLSYKYELVLLTNYFKESQMNRLNNMGIGHFFLECYGEELIKPNPEIYLKACRNHLPSECVMIGDNYELDIKVPKSLGMHTIYVNSKNSTLNSKDSLIVSSVEEISVELIEQLGNSILRI